MTTASVSVNGVPALSAVVSLASWGLWWLDVQLADAAELSGRVVGDFSGALLSGTVIAGGPVDGRAV